MKCIDCGQEMDLIQQLKWDKTGSIELHTCYNPDCDLSSITLTSEQFKGLTAEQLEEYRIVVRARKYAEAEE